MTKPFTIAGARLTLRGLGRSAFGLGAEFLDVIRCHRGAAAVWSKAAEVYPEGRAIFLAERGLSHARMKDRETAVRDVEAAMRLAPGNPWFLVYMAWVHEELGSPSEAITFFDRAAASESAEISKSMRQSIRGRIDVLRQSQPPHI